jgi:hypothetical protein
MAKSSYMPHQSRRIYSTIPHRGHHQLHHPTSCNHSWQVPISVEQYRRVTVRMIVERIAPMAIGSSCEKRGSSSRQVVEIVVDWWFEKVISAI